MSSVPARDLFRGRADTFSGQEGETVVAGAADRRSIRCLPAMRWGIILPHNDPKAAQMQDMRPPVSRGQDAKICENH